MNGSGESLLPEKGHPSRILKAWVRAPSLLLTCSVSLSTVGAPPRQLSGPREDDSPERPTAGRRLVPDNGENGGQHAKEEHKQECRQVKVVGPARKPSATCGRHPMVNRW